MGVQQIRVQQLDLAPALTVLCPGFEFGLWRDQALVADLFDRHLPSFALSFTEFEAIDGSTAASSLRKAARAVYDTDKYGRRGEFGELMLHAAAIDFFEAQPAISKLFFKDSPNDTVKGFDSVHVIQSGGEIELWLGEVKFYKDVRAASRDAAQELTLHLSQDFLRREFIAVTNKLDANWPHTPAVTALLDNTRSLDEVLPNLVIPVLLTYDSQTVSRHTSVCDAYVQALSNESTEVWDYFISQLKVAVPVTLHLILVPLHDKENLVALFHNKLRSWQQI